MREITLRKINLNDKKYFTVWWRDKELLELTSGDIERISNQEVDRYFQNVLDSKADYHYMILADNDAIGHISLSKRQCDWYEIQIIIGDKNYWSKGYGTRAIELLIDESKHFEISKIYLEVRPTNVRAIKAYEKCGFKQIKTISYPNNKFLPETIRMELKKLTIIRSSHCSR